MGKIELERESGAGFKGSTGSQPRRFCAFEGLEGLEVQGFKGVLVHLKALKALKALKFKVSASFLNIWRACRP